MLSALGSCLLAKHRSPIVQPGARSQEPTVPATHVHKPFTVLLTEHLASEAKAWLRERCDLVERSHRDPGFGEALARADALIVRTYTRVDDAMLAMGLKLKVVARAGVGLDNIDVAACVRRGIPVVYTPEANTQAVVEYTLMLLGDAVRPRHEVIQVLPAEQWEARRAAAPLAREFASMTVGILGLGRIGKRIANVLTALGSRVIYHDIIEIPPDERHGSEPVGVEQLFSESDAVSIHIDNRPSNRYFVGAWLLNRMKPNAILINTARGFVIDSSALAEYLRANPEATAMLDVHDPEPFGPEYPLLAVPNARLYPHLAARTERAMANMSWVVRDVMAVLEGKAPQFRA
jgi:phosphoglycerate dehydrogenase-like enzyme